MRATLHLCQDQFSNHTVFFAQVESQGISVNGTSSEQMEEEVPEDEACDVSQEHSAPPDSPTPLQPGPAPTPAESGLRPAVSHHALPTHHESHNGAKHVKPNTEKHTDPTKTQSEPQLTLNMLTSIHPPEVLSEKMENGKIKMEETSMVADKQLNRSHLDNSVYFEDALSTLATVVCSSIHDTKALEEKLFVQQTSDICSVKSEREEPYQNHKHQEQTLNNPDKDEDNPHLKDSKVALFFPKIQSLVEHRSISIDQAIAIEALTQLAATPETVPFKIDHQGQNPQNESSLFTNFASSKPIPLQEAKSKSEVVSNKVPVINSSLHQTSVICSPFNRQENPSHHSTPTPHKLSLHDLLKASSECEKILHTQEKGRISQALCKTERIDGTFKKVKHVDRTHSSRRRDEEEVAVQLVQLAFMIESQHKPVSSENSPPKGMPVPTIKFNHAIGQHIKRQRKKTTSSSPRISKKRAAEIEGGNHRIPLAKRSPNGKALLKMKGKKEALQPKAKLHSKRNPFLPQTQIDLKKYLGHANSENRRLFHFSNCHKREHLDLQALMSSENQNTQHFKTDHAPLVHCHGNLCQPNGHCHSLANGHLGATQGQRHECEEPFLSQVSKTHSVLNHGAKPQAPCAMPNVQNPDPSASPGRQHTLNHEPHQAFVDQNGYCKVETSGSVTVLSVSAQQMKNGDVECPREHTPTKYTLNSFLESPLQFLDTPAKNLFNTPSKKTMDPPTCDCMGKIEKNTLWLNFKKKKITNYE